ncbi:cytochrome P450 [Mycena sanguinolenta]|nr:cytochrome P450 [Mycena sanguinolenta]
MSSHPQPFSTAVVVLLASCTYAFYRLSRRSPRSFRNIAGPPAETFLLGNIPQLMSGDGYEFHADLAQNYGGVVKLHAICGDKHLYVFDPAAMHSILVKNEPIYNMPDAFIAANHLMFGPCLVSTSGARHRRARKIMNPVFSPSRLKEILPILYKIAHEMSASISERLSSSKTAELDMLKILGTTALEFIGQAGLGYSFAAAQSDALEGMKQLLFAAKRMIVPMQLLPFLLRTTPAAFRRWMINFVPMSDLHLARDLVDVMDNNSRQILAKKREAIAKGDAAVMEQVGQGKDIMSLLMRASDNTTQEDKLSEEEFLGQMNVIIFAGTDTTSTAVSRALQELAIHPEIQAQLREEVTKAAVHGDLDYDTLCSLPLLEAVCRETLRMYPPAITSSRQAQVPFYHALEDAVLPLERPMMGLDQTPITEIFVPAGTIVHIGIKAANTNCAIWGPDAREWKPARWLTPLPQAVMDAQIPGIYTRLMTFIGGPRGCIGFKFAEMSMKVLLAVLIKDFVFVLSDKKIVWKLGQAEAPSVDDKQMLPMMVSSVCG